MTLIKSLKLTWLSSQRIKQISHGEITNPKTINARTFKPEAGGLFDWKIWPNRNFECYCGKHQGRESEGLLCDHCGGKIEEKDNQRWRPAHYHLAIPVTNMLIFKSHVTQLSKLLKIPSKKLEDIIYFRVYVVLDNGLSNLVQKKTLLTKKVDSLLISSLLDEIIANSTEQSSVVKEVQVLQTKLTSQEETDMIFWEDYWDFIAQHLKIKMATGSEALRVLLQGIDLEKELIQAQEQKKPESIRFLQGLIHNQIQLEWMIIEDLFIIPCGLRPATKLKEENTIATTQINNFYRKIILINERVKHYQELNKTYRVLLEEIVHNEKRRLQKAVDELHVFCLQNLSGKEGILRNSLGKRVDYSGRSVITPNPHLLLNQVGLPIKMALVLFRPFLVRKICQEKIAFTVKAAEQLIRDNDPVIFPLLNEVMQDHPVLINRAPTLHRISVQGAYPRPVRRQTLELHPLLTTPLNADFDGDQIGLYVPLTPEARQEIEKYALSSQQIVDPKNGLVITTISKDMILGIYHLTCEKKAPKLFFYEDWGSLSQGCEKGQITIQDLIVVPASLVTRCCAQEKNRLLLTTYGKLLFNRILPESFPYYLNNLENYEARMENLIQVSEITEKWQNYSPQSGWRKKPIIAFINDLVHQIPREEMVDFLDKLKKIGFDYATTSGISISPFELGEVVNKENHLASAWEKIRQAEDYYRQGFYSRKEIKQKKIEIWTECKDNLENQLITNLATKKDTSFYNIWDSGARASSENLTQIFALRGNVANYLGEIMETPIISSLWEGMNPNEFFISVYGAIKGMIDVALKTASAGDLARRLAEASQSIIITAEDCQTRNSILCQENDPALLAEKIYGRCLAQDLTTEQNGVILARNTFLFKKQIQIIQTKQITAVEVRSPLGCELELGICQACYGSDLSRPGEAIALHTAVGIIAAQSLSEPGTQLTMRTFHTGGIAAEEDDIIQGLDKVKQIFDNVKIKELEKAILARNTGEIVSVEKEMIKQNSEEGEIVYPLRPGKKLRVQLGDKVVPGERLTTGKVSLEEYLTIMGRSACQDYIKNQIRKVYSGQGIDINEKHIEIFARLMLSKVEVTASGDSNYLVGDIVDYWHLQKLNQKLQTAKKQPVVFKNIISSLKDLASHPASFLAGISFQNALKGLVNYALYNPIDYLQSPKECVMAGQLVPVGTGFKEKEKYRHRFREK